MKNRIYGVDVLTIQALNRGIRDAPSESYQLRGLLSPIESIGHIERDRDGLADPAVIVGQWKTNDAYLDGGRRAGEEHGPRNGELNQAGIGMLGREGECRKDQRGVGPRWNRRESHAVRARGNSGAGRIGAACGHVGRDQERDESLAEHTPI